MLGAGELGHLIVDLIRSVGVSERVCFLDDRFPYCNNSGDVSILGRCEDFEIYVSDCSLFFVGVDDNVTRRKLFDRICAKNGRVISLISPSAIVSARARVGLGATIMSGVVVNAAAQIGNNVIVESDAIIEHDCVVGDHSYLARDAIIAGGVRMGDYVRVGHSAVLCPGVCLASDVTLGAASVVSCDLAEAGNYSGAPAVSV